MIGYARVIITPSRYPPPSFGAARCGPLIEYIDGIFFPPLTLTGFSGITVRTSLTTDDWELAFSIR